MTTSLERPLDESMKAGARVRDWISLPAPGVVRLETGKVDIGQGISTALHQICADELCVDLARVELVRTNTVTSPDEGVTSGSQSVQRSGNAIRRACASLRRAALEHCAHAWQCGTEQIDLVDGTFTDRVQGRQADYWILPLGTTLDAPVDREAPGLRPEQFRFVGRDVPRRDIPGRIWGEPVFIQDLTLPGMMHGRVVRVGNRFARLREIRIGASELAERWPSAILVRDGSFVAVLAESEHEAIQASAAVAQACDWDMPDAHPEADDLLAFLRRTPSERRVAIERGARAEGSPQFRATYSRQMLAHASIGPSCALARWGLDATEVWSHSQGVFNLRVAFTTFLTACHPERLQHPIIVHHVEGSGCYGHNPADDVAFDALLVSRFAKGRPVRVLWSRADELGCGPYGPAQVVDIEASLDATGAIQHWNQQHWANGYTLRPGRQGADILGFIAADQIATPFTVPVSTDPPLERGGGSDRNAVPQYDIPNLNVYSNRLLEMPIRTSALRALGGHPNVFAIESCMDELALRSGQDPVAFRLRHLKDPRAHDVIRAAIGGAPWWKSKAVEGEGHGMAYARYKHKGAWCAVALRILAHESIVVTDVSVAVDVGLAVNPDGVRNQIEGGVIQSCSWTLHEAVRFDRQSITTRSWADYPILRFSSAPRVQVDVLQRPHEESLGAGEAAMGPTAAAIAIAIHDALGVRARHMPITMDSLMKAIDAE